jgi:hypothetical protein
MPGTIYVDLAPIGTKTRYTILKRINEIKKETNNFDKKTVRWKNFETGFTGKHIADVILDRLDDQQLVSLFERIIRRYYTQM